jgi:hypothetical protein
MSSAFPALRAKNPVLNVGANVNGGRIASMYSIDDTAALCDCIMLNSMYDIFLVDNILGHPSVSLVSITLGPGHPPRFVDRGGESPCRQAAADIGLETSYISNIFPPCNHDVPQRPSEIFSFLLRTIPQSLYHVKLAVPRETPAGWTLYVTDTRQRRTVATYLVLSSSSLRSPC